jgi:hypothetical protein
MWFSKTKSEPLAAFHKQNEVVGRIQQGRFYVPREE